MNVFRNKFATYGRLPIRSRTQIYFLRILPNAISYSNTLARELVLSYGDLDFSSIQDSLQSGAQ